MGIIMCCQKDDEYIDINFKPRIEKIEGGGYKTVVVNKKGESLKLFCDYGTIKYYNEVNESDSVLAEKKFQFLNNEIDMMIDYFIKNDLLSDRTLFYKIEFYDKSDTIENGNLKFNKSFYLNGECYMENKYQIMKYRSTSIMEGKLDVITPIQSVIFETL